MTQLIGRGPCDRRSIPPGRSGGRSDVVCVVSLFESSIASGAFRRSFGGVVPGFSCISTTPYRSPPFFNDFRYLRHHTFPKVVTDNKSPFALHPLSMNYRQAAVVAPRAAARTQVVASASKKQVATAATAVPALFSAPAAFAAQELNQVALQDVNILGVIATALFIIIPTSFLIILYVKSASEGNVSGGFSQEYYDKSKARGDKKTNEAAVLKGKGLGMRPTK